VFLLIDNYDSFTYNLYQYFSEQDVHVNVVRNDKISLAEIAKMNPEAIILSPGPGLPEQAGICKSLIEQFYDSLPIFGVCLGHQAIAIAFGAKLKQSEKIMHGKTSDMEHCKTGLFANLPDSLEVMRYHSYVVDQYTLPEELEITALSKDDEEIMAIKHKDYPVYGVQFHPESIGTVAGKQIIQNFLQEIQRRNVG
jgi:anthranilate synthase component II